MTPEKRTELIKQLQDERLKILTEKGKAYAQDSDTNWQFKLIAELLGLTPFQVWAVVWLKHVLCITNAIKFNPDKPIEHTESMKGRIIDVENYGDILFTMLEDEKETL